MTELSGRYNPQTASPAADVIDVASLEKVLARRHKTPEQVEQFGVEAVPDELKTTGFWDLFAIQLSFQINNFTIIVPGLAVVAGLNIWAAILSQVIGVGLVFIGYVGVAHFGAKYGIPGQVGTRFAFGILGSRVTASLMRAIASAYWFAWQTIAASMGIQAILKSWIGTEYSLVPISVAFAIFQAVIALTGWELLRYLSRVILPIKLVLLTVVILTFLVSDDQRFLWSNVNSGGSWEWSKIAFWAGTIASGHLSMYTDSADLARYANSARTMMLAFFSAAMLSVVFCGFLRAYAAKAMGDANWFAAATHVAPHVWMYILLLIVVVADNWFINVMNLYTGGFAIVNVVSRIGRFWATVIAAIAGVALSGFRGIYENTPTFVTEIGFAFAPIAGILLAHYIVLCQTKIDVPSLYRYNAGRYRYYSSINPIAIIVALFGYLLARSDIVSQSLLRPLLVVVFTGAVYAVAMIVVARFWPPARDAIDHEAMKDRYDSMDIDRHLLAEQAV